MTSEEKKNRFIKKANEKFNNKFDYSKVEYINSQTKICIICPEHGEFWTSPSVHLNSKHGCPYCGRKESNRMLTSEEFIKKAKEIHGDKYDYSKVEYCGWNKKVCIICPEHGEFWQSAINHIGKYHKNGCPQCGKILSAEKEVKKRPDYKSNFIKKAIEIYHGKYDYSNINYVNSHTLIKFFCKEHGEFLQTPSKHLCGQECPICQKKIRHHLSSEEKAKIFIEKAKEIHGNKYDYSKVVYKDARTSVCIICPEHGEFWQKPIKHLKTVGCWKCYNKYQEITYEDCFLIAKKYKTYMDFRRNEKKTYYKAKSKNWLQDYIWLEDMESELKTQIIYAYEFPNKNVYVGLTCNLHKRDVQHRYKKNKDTVFKFAEKNNIEIPVPKILEENLTRIESKEREQYWADFYKNNGYSLINRCKCGNLGGNVSLKEITNDEIIQECKKYKNQEQLYRENRKIYNLMISRCLKKICFPNTKFRVLVAQNNYTDDFILNVVMKYNTKNELRLNNFTVYHWLWSHKRLYNYFDKISGENFLKK